MRLSSGLASARADLRGEIGASCHLVERLQLNCGGGWGAQTTTGWNEVKGTLNPCWVTWDGHSNRLIII